MNAYELFHKDGRTAGAFYCSKCRVIHPSNEAAEQCCAPYKCQYCGKETERNYHTCCDACRAIKDDERELERFTKSEKLTEWDGPVYSEGLGYRDGFFESVADMIEELGDAADENDEVTPVTYVWTCRKIPFAIASLDTITERITEEGYEDFDPDDLNGLKELEDAIDKFNKVNNDIVKHEPDFNVSVLVGLKSETSTSSAVSKSS